MYKCIKGLSIVICDDDGFTKEDEYLNVEKGTVWQVIRDNFRMVGGEIRLENEEIGWMEISKETLEKYFEKII